MGEWIIPPGELMPGLGGSLDFGVWDGKRFHNGVRGSSLKAMPQQTNGHLCHHSPPMNPNNCLQCFHERTNAPRQQAAPPKRGPTVQTSPVVVAVKQRAGVGSSPMGAIVPHVDEPVRMGKEKDGKDIPAPTRGPMPKPVIYGAGPHAPGNPQKANVREPFSYANDQGRVDSEGLWKPSRHRSLIDSLPSHPEAVKK